MSALMKLAIVAVLISLHLFQITFAAANATSLEIETKQLTKILVDSTIVVNVTIVCKDEKDKCFSSAIQVRLVARSTQPDNIRVVRIERNSTIIFTPEVLRTSEHTNFSFPITLTGLFPGFFDLETELLEFGDKNETSRQVFKGNVVRQMRFIDFAINNIVRVIIFITYTNMGCQLDLGVVKQALLRPIGPVVGFLSQFIVMPLASYVVGYFLLYEKDVWRLGLFLLGCSPGGNSSNFWTLIFKGDLNLSITMTFISCIACLGMMPLWLYTLGKTISKNVKLEVPFENLVISLVSLTAPLFVGVFIKYWKPKWALYSKKIIRPLTIIVIISMLTVAIITQLFIFRMFTVPIVFIGFLIAFCGYFFGAVFAWLFGLNREQIIAVSIETAFQNGGIAFLILRTSFGYPAVDVASVPVIAQLLITGNPLWLVYGAIKLTKRIRQRKSVNIIDDSKREMSEISSNV
ncbi:sodium/bile acid cotransporter-like protein [Dinothrombium tinctorium]|uniref:Sodium/bile acid cotransporter-like protein n=1 Tax=Dinothrombium tinctorium TaxID=1965070 RepID=A0A3S3PN48_9ACAR|nr:sodium/bile acid cotransporter-like protein [Dinothrombium tinctorium]RWS13162.1 sodium/bile acid cotransporter-like protein [Dinothrombium tinctorium]RWS13607.1 sodium/bile acid cotransporter-like protein [Dinothrombium tinctorium]